METESIIPEWFFNTTIMIEPERIELRTKKSRDIVNLPTLWLVHYWLVHYWKVTLSGQSLLITRSLPPNYFILTLEWRSFWISKNADFLAFQPTLTPTSIKGTYATVVSVLLE